MAKIFEVDLWLQKQQNHYLWGGPETIEQSPFSIIESYGAICYEAV